MAKTLIQGLTIKIGADTKQFSSAMKQIDSEARTIAKDLKTVSQSLKIDSGDAQSYADKLKLLQEAAKTATTKVTAIQQAIEKLNQQYSNSKAKQELYNKSLKELDDALKAGKISHEDYERTLEAVEQTYGKGLMSQKEYESSLATLERRLESATYEQNLAVNALDQYQRETSNTASDVDKLGDEQKETNKEISNLSSVSGTAGKSVVTLGDLIKGSLISAAIQKGLSIVVDLAKSLARHLAEAVKDLKNYSIDAIKLAASYEDALGYTTTIYGEKVGAQVKQWVEENTNALRIYKGDLLENVNTFGQLFQTMSLGAEDSFEMATNIMSLAADLRAATGKDITEILESLISGFTTTTRTLRQFGVRINEAEIKAYALDKGIVQLEIDQTKLRDTTLKVKEAAQKQSDAYDKYGESSLEYERATVNLTKAEENLDKLLEGKVDTLTAAERATAIYMMILEQLDPVIGQNERESNLFNSQLAEAKTRMQNLKETIGEQLLPVANDLLMKFNEFLETEEGQAVIDSFVDAFGRLAGKASELAENEKIDELADKIVNWIPDAVNWVETAIEKVAEFTPLLGELLDKILALFGIKSEAEQTRDAFNKVAGSVEDLGIKYRIGIEDVVKAVDIYAHEMGMTTQDVYDNWDTHAFLVEAKLAELYDNYSEQLSNSMSVIDDFAKDNDVELSEVLNNWGKYEPMIAQYLSALGNDYEQDTGTIIKAITDYADANDLELQDVINKWNMYEPEIVQHYTSLKDETEGLSKKIDEEMQKMPQSVQDANEKLALADISGLEMLKSRIGAEVDQISRKFDEVFGREWEIDQSLIDQSTPDWLYGSNSWSPYEGRAGGGQGYAHVPYIVGDDSQNRPEIFIPDTDGRFLNGYQTERILQNISNNNSRNFNGGMQVYVISNGMDLATVAEELGEAVIQKLRMSGA